MADVVRGFRQFYQARAEAGIPVERSEKRMCRVAELTDGEIQAVIVSMPLKRYQQQHYLDYARDVAWIQFNPSLWRQLTDSDLDHVRALCRASVERYYARLRKE